MYLIIVNVIGFILFAINTWFYSRGAEHDVDSALTITSLLGGSAGILLAILLIQRKAVKENMMSRVFLSSIIVIQIIIVLAFYGFISQDLSFAFWTFFEQQKALLLYLILINIATFFMFVLDKRNAVRHKSRIRNTTLLSLSFVGGSLGGILAMRIFKHKIRKDYFDVGLRWILAMQIVVILFLMNLRI
ncbi:DUF1294 domain-containing protein [Jeotgalibaca arthritidis]|uniref:DUF1294 domain-containing protein n=1 Tax=Jeotgalibaca arthritidis TaxID=1868794 RepID=UPI0035A030D6